MTIRELEINGLIEINLQPACDFRGFFMRTYDREFFFKHGLEREWVQENHSRTLLPGTIRGLHIQVSPFSETKLVRCIRGAVFDVAVDLRPGSATFGTWASLELTEDNCKMLYIPRGFAHGFCSLTENCEIVYKVDNVYSPQHERGIIWNDKELNIEWPVHDPILSEKDRSNLTLTHFLRK